MIQRHQPHPERTFPACSSCGREPRHIVCTGASSRKPLDVRSGGPGERHALECSRCSRTTARHGALADARAEWETAYAKGAQPLRAVSSRRRVA